MNERYIEIHTPKDVDQRIRQLASEITASHAEDNPLFVVLLRGGMPFASQLMREIARQAPDYNPELDYMTTSRYGDSQQPNPEAKIVNDISPSTEVLDRPVIILDDVLDMGETARTVRDHIINLGARSVELAVLIEKDAPRTVDIKAAYVGFKAEDAWLVGMGMDDGAVAKESRRWDASISKVVPLDDDLPPQLSIPS